MVTDSFIEGQERDRPGRASDGANVVPRGKPVRPTVSRAAIAPMWPARRIVAADKAGGAPPP